MCEAKSFYKVLAGNRSCHGGDLEWPLPTDDSPGDWVEFAGEIVPCESGLHLTDCPAKWFTSDGLSVYEAEREGEYVRCDDDKIVCRRVRLLRLLAPAEMEGVCVFTSGTHSVAAGHAVAYGSASVRAYGSASVRAYGSARVEAYDSASVRSYDSANVEAYGWASVRAYGSASVRAYDSASVRAYGSARVEAYGLASVQAYGWASVQAYDWASVRAYDSASVQNFSASCQVILSSLAIQIDRSKYGTVVIRHCPGAAVTCEPAAAD